MVKQAHVINPRCDVQIFSTVHGCGKHDVNCAISTEMSLTSLTITHSEILTKVWLCSQKYTRKVKDW